jgi:hypothetical protein
VTLWDGDRYLGPLKGVSYGTGVPGSPWRARPHFTYESTLVPRCTPGASASCDVIDCFGRRTLVDYVGTFVTDGRMKSARGMPSRVTFVDVLGVSTGWRIG